MAEKKVCFPTPSKDGPFQPEEDNIRRSEASGFLEMQSFNEGQDSPQAAWARNSGEMLAFITEKVGQAATFLDPAEQAVDVVLNAKGYEVVRQKFKSDLTFGVVGMGSFGKVYKAKKGDREFGIKMIEQSSLMQHFIAKEIDALGMVRHPCIVNYVETLREESKDWIFIVQEFAAGGDLQAALINQPEAFDEALVRVMMFHICCAVGFAHQSGIMHRDMKPENVLLTTEGFPKVCDFGLSRNLNQSANAETQVGTPVYMAPEMLDGESYDFSVDTYAIGLMLQDMMAKETVMEWAIFRIPENFRPKKKQWPGGQSDKSFSDPLCKISAKMSDKQARLRPSLFAVIEELKQLAASQPMPHPFWGAEEIVVPQAAPIRGGTRLRRLFTVKQGPNIAKEHGLEVGVEVKIRASGDSGEYYDGVVEYVSHAIVPGAVHVRYKVPPKNEERVRIIDPMHYSNCLMIMDATGAPVRCKTQGGSGGLAGIVSSPTGSMRSAKQKCCILQ